MGQLSDDEGQRQRAKQRAQLARFYTLTRANLCAKPLHVMTITEPQLRSILAGLEKVMTGPGFGTVELVIEKGRIVRIRTTVDEWIENRRVSPVGETQPASPPQGGR
jgi:hypothetical protein